MLLALQAMAVHAWLLQGPDEPAKHRALLLDAWRRHGHAPAGSRTCPLRSRKIRCTVLVPNGPATVLHANHGSRAIRA
jgi:hypothetical protein